MKIGKKFLALVMALIMVVGTFTTGAVVALAADAVETEPNNSYSAANALTEETELSASLSNVIDVDWFKFTAAADGKVGITFSHEAKEISSTLFTVQFMTFEKENEPKTAGAAISSKGQQTVSVGMIDAKAGTTYYIMVSTTEEAAAALAYTVKFGAVEADDTAAGATALTVDEAAESTLRSAADVDYFSFVSDGEKLLTVDFTHAATEETGICFKFDVYDAAQNLIASGKSAGTEAAAAITNAEIKAGTYYIAVSAGEKFSDAAYQVAVKLADCPYTKEAEANDTVDTANALTLGKPVKASLADENDEVDYFSFTAANKSLISVTVDHAKTDSADKAFNVAIYKKDGILPLLTVKSKGTDETVSYESKLIIAAGDYVAKVTGDCAEDYYLTVNLAFYQGEETEDNNTIEKANEIVPASLKDLRVYLAELSDNTDVDCYKFTLAKRGYIYVHFNNFDTDADTDFDVAVTSLSSGAGVVEEAEVKSFTVAADEATVKSSCIGLDKGTYYVKVSTASATGGSYAVGVQKGEFAVYEIENNDTAEKANALLAGTDAYAITAASFDAADVDWFCFPYDASKACTITFARSYTNTEIANGVPGTEKAAEWVALVYSANDLENCIKSVTFSNDLDNGTKAVTLSGLESGTYYIKVKANESKLSDKDYLIAVKNAANDIASRWEQFVARIKAIDWSGFWKNFEFAKTFDLNQVKALLKHALESLGVIFRAVIGKNK